MGGGILLSIVIPVYNREKFIRECLDSIVNQPVDFSVYEIICVDDGSVDNSLSILKEYEEKFPQITVISQENQGASSARNHGLDKATGKYIWFIDSDDYICENSLKDLLSLLIAKQPEILILDTKIDYNKKGEIIESKKLIPASFTWGNVALLEVVNKHGIRFDKNIVYGEDTLFWYRAYAKCSKIIHYSKPIYYYNFHENNIMSQAFSSRETVNKRISDIYFSCKVFSELLKQKDLTRVKKKNIKDKRNSQIEFVLSSLLPYAGVTYKEGIDSLKKLKLYPYGFRKESFLKIFKANAVKHKFSYLIMWLFPLEIFYKMYFKRITKNKEISA